MRTYALWKDNIVKNKLVFIFVIILCIFEGILSIGASFAIPTDSKNAFLFGYSKSRLAIFLFLFLGVLFFIGLLFFKNIILEFIKRKLNSQKSIRVLTVLGILFFFLLWITIFTPTKNFFPFEALFIRLKPAIIWFELIVFQITIGIKISKNSFVAPAKVRIQERNLMATLSLILIAIWTVISVTKVGLVKDTAFWNVPGIPTTTLQLIGILLFIFLSLILESRQEKKPIQLPKVFIILIPILLYLTTVIVWGSTPMLKHFFSLEPTPPNLQPYPYSDARIHDLGSISILQGQGIYFHGYTDKPLYMVFLAILHLFTKNNYSNLQWAQIFVLALIPVFLYFFGKKYLNSLFGIVLSVLMILQQRNAIVLSYKVASVNPKLEVTEEPILLGIVLVTYLLFLWMRNPEAKKILLLGGLIGALSLIRINPLFLFPAVVLIIIIKLWKSPRSLRNQLVLFCVGFFLVFSPWLITGTDVNGKSWLFLKIQDVIQNRYPTQVEIIQPVEKINPKMSTLSSTIQKTTDKQSIQIDLYKNLQENQTNSDIQIETKKDSLVFLMFDHFLHNFSTTLLSLPNSIIVDNLKDLSLREYWQDNNHWNGTFPFGEYLLILVNLILISLGIAKSWMKYRWAGFSPLIVFVMYDLSLSAALNSGGRYIVPINWIIYFYYAFGVISICQIILVSLGIKIANKQINDIPFQETPISSSFKSLIPSICVLVLAASLIPAANFLLPNFIHPKFIDEQTINLVRDQEPKNNQILSGEILYPYFHIIDNIIDFDFLDGSDVTTYHIQNTYLLPTQITYESGSSALLSFSGPSDNRTLESIYIIYNYHPVLIWHYSGE